MKNNRLNELAIAAKDDGAAFRDLVIELEPYLRKTAHKISVNLAHVEEQDVYQALLIGLNEIVRVYDPERAFIALLCTKTRRVAYKLSSKPKGIRFESLDEIDPETETDGYDYLGEEKPALSTAYQNERAYELMKKVLKGDRLEYAYLRYVEGWSIAEIADKFGVDVKRVYHITNRAKERLAQALDPETGEPKKRFIKKPKLAV